MATSLAARVQATMAGTYTDARDLGTVTYPETFSYTRAFTNGVAINMADLMFDDTRPLTTSQVENLDLAGVLVDAVGRTVTAVKIVAIGIKAPTTNTVDIVFGNHATAAFVGPFGAATHTLALQPGGCIILCAPSLAGWPVTATTADMIKVANGAAASSYDIVIFGRSA
jgi:hypothetical protein